MPLDPEPSEPYVSIDSHDISSQYISTHSIQANTNVTGTLSSDTTQDIKIYIKVDTTEAIDIIYTEQTIQENSALIFNVPKGNVVVDITLENIKRADYRYNIKTHIRNVTASTNSRAYIDSVSVGDIDYALLYRTICN